MSGRILSHRLGPLLRNGHLARHIHNAGSRTGGLLRADGGAALRGRAWPVGANAIHNVPAVRSISFARMLPKLALKLVRVPAMFGGATIAGLAYFQYQATQAGNYAMDVFRQASETAGNTASTLFQGLQDMADQTQRGWNKTTEDIDIPDWLQKIIRPDEESESGKGDSSGGGKKPKQSRAGTAAAAAATTTAFGYNKSGEEDLRPGRDAAEDDQMMLLTRKMIEIRNILQTIGQSGTLTLPSIVVIGSQSSGKSSVLEAIVGHEFLPKGSNMVTRRPIELTLVNTPNAQAEYGEFPALGLGKITDFSQTIPFSLRYISPNVPDLSLIDLPGYIQVAGRDQPPELKQKIADLCDKYIQPPNVILAISAADVDLANSTALRASRRVDPRGERTIGVITKMDLVSPERGHDVLSDKKYPLRLGYVGVVTLGVSTLRKTLMQVLEQTMSSSLSGTRDAISQELEEATYEFKVQYNDRPLSAESHLAESLDAFKHSFKAFAESFGRPQVREMLKAELDQRVMDILAQRYWNKPVEDLDPPPLELDPLKDLPKADAESLYWHRKLDASTSSLTKLGIGRLATTVVANSLNNHVDSLLASSTFASHPGARKQITDACTSILNDKFFSTSDQVENCIKPYKFEIEIEDPEWAKGRDNVGKVLKEELRSCESAMKHVEDSVGKRKLKDVVSFIDRVRKGEVVLEGNGEGGAGGFSAALLERGREGLFLRDRADLIKMRLLAVRSKQCATQKNKYYCPEVFLDVVADKLTSTAVLFLNVELLSEFYYNFPRELDSRLGRHLSDAEVEMFAREDPRIRRHLDVIRKKELLELALQKIEGIRQLDGRTRKSERAPPGKETRSRWNLF
ncbi:Dynamin [Penicillium expansum]|nr:Dynamin [Penicillium expansum]